jgi:guanylate kinase
LEKVQICCTIIVHEGKKGGFMRLLFCVMGDICNGKYEIYQYLVDNYGFHPYRTLTTKKEKNSKFDTFEYVTLQKMLVLERTGDIIGMKRIRGHHFGKRLSAIPDGFSVCIIDYLGYLELSSHFNTVPILIQRSRLNRFKLEDCDVHHPTEFLAYENLNKKQYEFALEDGNIKVLKPKTMIDLKLKIDEMLEIYLDDIAVDSDFKYDI